MDASKKVISNEEINKILEKAKEDPRSNENWNVLPGPQSAENLIKIATKKAPKKQKTHTPRQSKYPKDEIRSLYFANWEPKQIREKFGIPPGTLNSWMFTEKWAEQRAAAQAKAPPKTIAQYQAQRKKNGELTKSDPTSVDIAVLQDWKEKGNTHRGRIHALIDELLKATEDSPPQVETIKDLDVLDQIARRTYGLEEKKGEGASGAQQLVNIQFLMGRVPLPPQS